MEIKTSMRVEKIQEVKTHTKNTDKELYALKGKDKDGVGSILIKLPQKLEGIRPDQVVDITITTSQMSLFEFDPKEKERLEKKKVKEDKKKKNPTGMPGH